MFATTLIISVFNIVSIIYFMVIDDYSLLVELIFNILVFIPTFFLVKFSMKRKNKTIQILALILSIITSLNCLYGYITKDYGIVSDIASYIGVMSAYFINYIKYKKQGEKL